MSLTFAEIIEKEDKLIKEAEKKYGDYFTNTFAFNCLLSSSIKSISIDGYLFGLFLSQVKKFALLAIFSAVRLHHVQTMLDLRFLLESGCNAAYAIAFPQIEHFITYDKDSNMVAPKELAIKRYKWIEKQFPQASRSIKGFKSLINNLPAHSNVVDAFRNFSIIQNTPEFNMDYFDDTEQLHVKTDLWQIGNTIMGFLDLFFGANKLNNVIVFAHDFVSQLKQLESENNILKNEAVQIFKDRIEKYAHNKK